MKDEEADRSNRTSDGGVDGVGDEHTGNVNGYRGARGEECHGEEAVQQACNTSLLTMPMYSTLCCLQPGSGCSTLPLATALPSQ